MDKKNNPNNWLYKINFLDKIIILAVTLGSILFLLFLKNISSGKAKTIVVKYGSKTENYALSPNRILNMPLENGQMKIEIKNGSIRVLESTCKKKICVNTGWISRVSQPITCLPNKVYIELAGTGKDFDAVTY